MVSAEELKSQARRHEAAGRYDRAVECYRRALERQKEERSSESGADPSLHLCLADLFFRQGRPDAALDNYRAAADSYARAGMLQNAVSVHKMSTRLFPERPEPHVHLAHLHLRAGREELAVERVRRLADGAGDAAPDAGPDAEAEEDEDSYRARVGRAAARYRSAASPGPADPRLVELLSEAGFAVPERAEESDAGVESGGGAGPSRPEEPEPPERRETPEPPERPDRPPRRGRSSRPQGRDRLEREEAEYAAPGLQSASPRDDDGDAGANWDWPPPPTFKEPPEEPPEPPEPAGEERREAGGEEAADDGSEEAADAGSEEAADGGGEEAATEGEPAETRETGRAWSDRVQPTGDAVPAARAEEDADRPSEAPAGGGPRAGGRGEGRRPADDVRQGLEIAEEMLRLRPGDPDLLRRKASYARRLGDERRLLEAWTALARSLQDRDGSRGARLLALRVLELDPENEEAEGMLGATDRAAVASADGPATPEAWTALEFPEAAQKLRDRVARELATEVAALRWLEAAVEASSGDAPRGELFRCYGGYLMARGRWEEAAPILERAAGDAVGQDGTPDADACPELTFSLGLVYRRLGRHQRAVACFRELARAEESFAVAWRSLPESGEL